MDKLFDYLIIGFVIYSFLAPLFKKKKGNAKIELPEDIPNFPDLGTEESGADEIAKWEQENFPQYSPEPARKKESKPDAIPPTYRAHYTDAVKERKLAEEVEREKEKFDSSVKQFLESQKEFEESENLNTIALSIKNKIRSADSLREYFVISEILDKPVGLRENGY